MCRLARAFAACTNWHSIAIWATTWEFWTGTKAQTRPSKCADSPKPSLFAWMTPKNSKWVWLWNITITNCRQTDGTERNSHTTITRHQENKLSKAASSLSSPSRWLQNKNGHKVTKYRTITESYNGSNQQQQNHRHRKDSSLSHWGAKMHFTGTKSSP